MSTPKTHPSEHENETINGLSAPELALRPPREVPSSNVPDHETTIVPSLGTRVDLSQSLPQRPLTPTTSSVSHSKSPSGFRSQSHDRSSISSRGTSPTLPPNENSQESRTIIVRSFAPRIAVYASSDTEEFMKGKGFTDGLYGLLRPFGERLQGKVIIRDSIGSSKALDDFGIRFVNLQHFNGSNSHHSVDAALDQGPGGLTKGPQVASEHSEAFRSGDPETALDQVLDREGIPLGGSVGLSELEDISYEPRSQPLQLHNTYLRKILSNTPLVPYETFSHPVACVIAVSSRHPAPIEALRQLYASTGHGSGRTPAWVGSEYLRYYVLIHDEEKDDITKSTALFDLMKRHFGLHCHLLRLRSSQCVETDDDSTRVPSCEWLSAGEEMDQIRAKDYTDDFEATGSYIVESDATAIKAFLREMVTQSVVPFMESRVMTWNDQIASRRRGISGRFMSLSKRWTGFGTAKTASSGSGSVPNSSGNFDYQRGFYPPESPEATMRQLGDYAFMLRDWKLAYSTYELLRSDFAHDKAWSYHAAANEMAAMAALLTPSIYSSKSRFENIDQLLDTAAYSYLTRCSMPSNVVRCLTLAMELLKTRGSIAVDDAARWGGRLLELGVLTPFGQALATERIADCYALRINTNSSSASSRQRQSAFWNILAAESWIRLDKPAFVISRLRLARTLYGCDKEVAASFPFNNMQPLWQKLVRAVGNAGNEEVSTLIDIGINESQLQMTTTEESEQLGQFSSSSRLMYISGNIDGNIDGEGFTIEDAGHSNLLEA